MLSLHQQLQTTVDVVSSASGDAAPLVGSPIVVEASASSRQPPSLSTENSAAISASIKMHQSPTNTVVVSASTSLPQTTQPLSPPVIHHQQQLQQQQQKVVLPSATTSATITGAAPDGRSLMNKTQTTNTAAKDRFRRLPQHHHHQQNGNTNPQMRQNSHSQNVSVLNGQSMDMSSDIYKIYIQDSRAAQNRLEMHKTLSLLQIQQVSRTASKDKDKQPSTRQSPQKGGFLSQNLTNVAQNITQIPTGSVLSQLSSTQQGLSHNLATTNKAQNLRKNQNSSTTDQGVSTSVSGGAAVGGKFNASSSSNNKIALATQALSGKIGSSINSNQRNPKQKMIAAGQKAAATSSYAISADDGLANNFTGILTATCGANTTNTQQSNFSNLPSTNTQDGVLNKLESYSAAGLAAPPQSCTTAADSTSAGKQQPSASIAGARHSGGANLAQGGPTVNGDYAHHGGRHQMAKKKMAQSSGGAGGKSHLGAGARAFLNQGPKSYEVYQRSDTISPINNSQANANVVQISAADTSGFQDPYSYYHHQNTSSKHHHQQLNGNNHPRKHAFDKSVDHSLKFGGTSGGGTSPTNGRARKRTRAPSGVVNKVKLVGYRTIKQAIEQATIRNEILSQPALKNVTPTKGGVLQQYDSASVTDQLDIILIQQRAGQQQLEANTSATNTTTNDQFCGDKLLVETSKIASANAQTAIKSNENKIPSTSQALVRQSDELDALIGGNPAHSVTFQMSHFQNSGCDSQRREVQNIKIQDVRLFD